MKTIYAIWIATAAIGLVGCAVPVNPGDILMSREDKFVQQTREIVERNGGDPSRKTEAEVIELGTQVCDGMTKARLGQIPAWITASALEDTMADGEPGARRAFPQIISAATILCSENGEYIQGVVGLM